MRMNGMARHWAVMAAAALLLALSLAACRGRGTEADRAELAVSIYIPDLVATKADTGPVGPRDAEKQFTSLQIWVYFSGGTMDGNLVGYKEFSAADLAGTGLPNAAVTRFGMPLSGEMFRLLSAADARVDVYAVANAAAATATPPGAGALRSELEALALSGSYFGGDPLTMAVPAAGLPMSGVLKAAPVTGDYPVLNVSTLTLTRAVSKIRFVFCQQGTPATDTDPAAPRNATCFIRSVAFGGTADGHDCQIAESEKLFTTHTYGDTDNPFEISSYTPLSAVISGEGDVLLPNDRITCAVNPEELLFRGPGHESESAREYEQRLDQAVDAGSQVGDIYLRETDKQISGTIRYSIGGEERTATFSMGADDVFTRNHSWILLAWFAEATRTLQLRIVVLPWDRENYDIDYTDNSVNVVRRFTIFETNPATFKKEQTDDGLFRVYFWHTLDSEPNVVKGDIIISTPVGQKLHVIPVPGVLPGHTLIPDAISVTPESAVIYPNYEHMENGRIEDCRIEFEIRCNPGSYTDEQLEGNYVELHFCVEIGDDLRWVDVDSESIDLYRIILKKNWNE